MDLERTAFSLRHLYVYPRLGIAYTFIPKNACTSFKRTLGQAEGWLQEGATTAHGFPVARWMRGLAAYRGAEERIVVVRDPFDRILSAYLNRFLMRRDAAADHAMATGLASIVGRPDATTADVSFADFVEYLTRTPNRRLNEHWRPQVDFLAGSYTRLIRFEALAEDTEFLTSRGLVLRQARGHATSTLRRNLGTGWGDRKARALRRLRKEHGHLPSRESMYDDRLHRLVAERYAEDVDLVLRSRRPALDSPPAPPLASVVPAPGATRAGASPTSTKESS